MEVMEIAERLIETYEGRVDFITWFSGMDFEQLIVLTIGDVVDFIVASLQAGPSGPSDAAVGAVGA
jgi:hypothetical protein